MQSLFNLILCHLVGDYVLQCDFIAQTKGKNYYHLLVHCLLYVLPFYVLYGFDYRIFILLIAHIIIDNLKARYGTITYLQDQLAHYLLLLMFLI